MHKRKDLSCEVLSVMMRHLNILKYFSFEVKSLWNLNYSRLAVTSLTVITEMFQLKV